MILVHSQFKLGALNSNVALACLLIVSASGLIGRYLYSRIHLGLYGARASLTELLAEAEDLKGAIDMDLGEHGHLWTLLADFERRALTAPRGVVGSMWHRMVIGHQTARSRRRLVAACRSAIARESRQQRWPRARRRQTQAMLRQHLSLYFATIRRAAGLSVYESLFGLWHVLHVPLFMLLVVTAIIHVIAVHLY